MNTNETVSEIISRIYNERKLKNPSFSLQYICQKSGIPSKGYLADVMKGRRKLKEEYAPKLATTLGLKRSYRKLFILLVKYEKARKNIDKDKLLKKIKTTRKQIKVQYSSLSAGVFNPFVFAKVFSSLGVLSKDKASARNIAKTIDENMTDTKDALRALVKQGWIMESTGYYSLKNDSHVFFTKSDGVGFHQKLVELSISNALEKFSSEFNNLKDTQFESTVVSVKYEKYIKKLAELRDYVEEFVSNIEEEDGDTLVNFNLQVFPVRPA